MICSHFLLNITLRNPRMTMIPHSNLVHPFVSPHRCPRFKPHPFLRNTTNVETCAFVPHASYFLVSSLLNPSPSNSGTKLKSTFYVLFMLRRVFQGMPGVISGLFSRAPRAIISCASRVETTPPALRRIRTSSSSHIISQKAVDRWDHPPMTV